MENHETLKPKQWESNENEIKLRKPNKMKQGDFVYPTMNTRERS
jgi:hypothetical protein